MNILILTEGGFNIGFGHITRCIALYQAFKQRGWKPQIIINGDRSVMEVMKNVKYQNINWLSQKKIESLISNKYDVILIDSYKAPKKIYEIVSGSVSLPVYIDDFKRINYPRGIVVNGSANSWKLNYPKKKNVIYFLGTQYSPIRREFWNCSKKIIKKYINKILITFGGSDSRNITPKVLKLLQTTYPDKIKIVIIGKGFNNIRKIQEAKDSNTKLIYFPNARRMKSLMQESDLAVSAAGQTMYELAAVGVPAIAVVVARNQINNARGWHTIGLYKSIFWWQKKNFENAIVKNIKQLMSYTVRKRQNEIARQYVDGKGAIRLVSSLQSMI
jgi:UDP-2,4-diacetamido-2,4,6-trideoxy-beta-L-altropyranose hydrolase